jgi:hypothetical protein
MIPGEKVQVRKQLKFQYVRATLFTEYQVLRIYHNGRLVH